MHLQERWLAVFAAVSLLAGGCCTCTQQGGKSQEPETAKPEATAVVPEAAVEPSYLSPGFEEVIRRTSAKVFPSVVFISVLSEDKSGGKERAAQVSGSGVLISKDGELLTNQHVIDKARSIRCQLYDGTDYSAKVLGSDKDLDIALLKLERPSDAAPLPFAKLRQDYIKEGAFVMAMGAPYGMSRSVSIGIISCAARYLPSNGTYTLWYQTDAAIAPGNSGGPLIDTDGEVVGINTLGLRTGGGIGFTNPSPIILEVLGRIRKFGNANWAWFGFELQPLHDFLKSITFPFQEGVMISGAEPGSPARKAGFQPQDRIVAVNGQPVTARTQEDLPAVRRLLGLLPFDQEAAFHIIRDGQPMDIRVAPSPKGKVEGDEIVLARWGFTAKTINRFDTPELSFYAPDGGVFLFGRDRDGNAARSGLLVQDIIVTVDGKPVRTLEELQAIYDEAMKRLGERTSVSIGVIRNGRRAYAVLNYAMENKE